MGFFFITDGDSLSEIEMGKKKVGRPRIVDPKKKERKHKTNALNYYCIMWFLSLIRMFFLNYNYSESKTVGIHKKSIAKS